MHTEHSTPEAFDHLPSPEEMLRICQEAEEKNPRSVFYKRTLVRPKIPVLKILLSLLLTAALCIFGAWGMGRLTNSALLAWLTGIGIFVAVCLIFSKKILITTVKLYQALAPAKMRKRCRYEPSCSVYMILAVEKYGTWKGFRKGMSRWRGCKPPNGGYDLP